MGQWPGERDGGGGDLADPDSGGHWGPDHCDTVADAVLPMNVLYSAHHTWQAFSDGDNEEGSICEDLIVVVIMDQLVADEPGEPGRGVAHCAAGQGGTLTVWVVNITGEAGDPGRS